MSCFIFFFILFVLFFLGWHTCFFSLSLSSSALLCAFRVKTTLSYRIFYSTSTWTIYIFILRYEQNAAPFREFWPFTSYSLTPSLSLSDFECCTLFRFFSLSGKKVCILCLWMFFGTVNTNHVNFGAFIMPFERTKKKRDMHIGKHEDAAAAAATARAWWLAKAKI